MTDAGRVLTPPPKPGRSPSHKRDLNRPPQPVAHTCPHSSSNLAQKHSRLPVPVGLMQGPVSCKTYRKSIRLETQHLHGCRFQFLPELGWFVSLSGNRSRAYTPESPGKIKSALNPEVRTFRQPEQCRRDRGTADKPCFG